MPHDQPWLDDYHKRHRAELQAVWTENHKIFEIQNRAIKTALSECPFDLRTPDTCRDCGNEDCIKAYKEQNKIWGEDNEEPVSVANTANTGLAEMARNAALKLPNSPESRNPTRPASGSEPDLFTLINREDEDMVA
jgi:hypothetical protein